MTGSAYCAAIRKLVDYASLNHPTRCHQIEVMPGRGVTTNFYFFDVKFLGETAPRIINEGKGVNRWSTTSRQIRRARS